MPGSIDIFARACSGSSCADAYAAAQQSAQTELVLIVGAGAAAIGLFCVILAFVRACPSGDETPKEKPRGRDWNEKPAKPRWRIRAYRRLFRTFR